MSGFATAAATTMPASGETRLTRLTAVGQEQVQLTTVSSSFSFRPGY